ncbi:L-arabinose ABC transporter permease AraH [Telmatospirillum siberiense]
MNTSEKTMAVGGTSSFRKVDTSVLLDRAGMLLVFLGLFVTCSIFVDNFLSWRNMAGLSLAISMAGMVSCSMLLCIASGNFDLSVGSVIAASGCVAAVVINLTGSVVVGILAGLGLGVVVGLINGFVFAKLGINAFITTLATMQMARGFGYIVAGGKAVGISNSDFFVIGTTYFLGLPTPVWLTLVTFAIFGGLINYTEFGRNILAIGGNEEAARLAGVPVVRTKILIFVIHGLMSAVAGVVLASRMTSGQPMTAIGFEMTAISACVLGGVSLAGGIGKISYVIAGVLILGTVENSMNLLNINPFYQYLVRGGILLAAVIFDRYKTRSIG